MKKIIVLVFLIVVVPACQCDRVPCAKSDVAFTCKIGWWPYQENLSVESLTTEIVDSSLHLFNAKSLIRINIKGTMQGPKGWKPRVQKVHLVEEVIIGGNFTNSLAEIRFNPIIEVKENRDYSGDPMPYDLTQELPLYSMGWGSNSYHIICGGMTNSITLMQRK